MSKPIDQCEVEALTRRVEGLEDRVEALQVHAGGNFAAVIEGQAALRREMRERFTAVDKRLDGMDKRLDGVDKRLDGVDKRLDGVDKRLEELTNEVRSGNARIVELLANLVGKTSK
jgi:tetrahydromethanopterin S-methyltransferase subunit G